MDALTPLLQCLAIAGIILAVAADLVFKSKETRTASVALALFAAMGAWAIDVFAEYPISEATGSAILIFRSEGADKDGKVAGAGNGSTVEIFNADTCILKLKSNGNSVTGLENGIFAVKQEYSLSVPGSFVNADFPVMQVMDSIVISESVSPAPIRFIDGELRLILNGTHPYGIDIDPPPGESRRMKMEVLALDRYRIRPERKADFGGPTLEDRAMEGTWMGSRTIPDRKELIVTSIVAADMREDHTYTATVSDHIHPFGMMGTRYKETGSWKSEKGRIRAKPHRCEAFRDPKVYGTWRIPCDRKHALVFELAGHSLAIGTSAYGTTAIYPMRKL